MDAAVAQFDDAEVRLIMILSYSLFDSQTKRTNLILLSTYLWSFFLIEILLAYLVFEGLVLLLQCFFFKYPCGG